MEHEIYLRCHTRILDEDVRSPNTRRNLSPLRYVLVLDTETTTDALLNLNFGVYQFCELSSGKFACTEEGLFSADDLDDRQLGVLRRYTDEENAKRSRHKSRLRLYDRTTFVEKVMYKAIQTGASIVAFNLPFDLSRLAVEYRVARRAGGRGWSLVVFRYRDKATKQWLPNTFRPRIQLFPKNSKAAFVRLAGGDMNQPYWSGRFLDLKTFVWALRNKSLSLDSACREFKVPGKLRDYLPSGQVTREEIDYCRQDVQATVGLLNALFAEFRKYPLGDLTPERAYSAASIAKAFLKTMGTISPKQKFQLDDKAKGICMQGYYGGRAEIRIRHTPVPVVYTDFTSQYPTVNTLLRLWPLLTADRIRVQNATDEVRGVLKSITVDGLLDQRTWPKLGFFALVHPDGDILPVRAVYGDACGDQTNIGLNPLNSAKPIWFAGPDIVASTLLTGRSPRILQAIRVQPHRVQQGMKPVTLGTGSIDPYADDFFRKVIEERKGKQKSDPLYYFLKILANAGCYGIYAEVNKLQVGKNKAKKIGIFSGELNGTERTCVMEVPGPWYFPPVASLITAGGRLLLAILERMVADAGGTYLMCDTDSMAIVASEQGGLVRCNGGMHRMPDGSAAIKALTWKKVQEIVDRFEALNPYEKRVIPGSILNIVQELNFNSESRQRQLYGYGISAKRYALYTKEKSGIHLIKVSEHGLGLYYRPIEGRDQECEVATWIKEGWQWMLNEALGFRSHKPKWFRLPVMRRIAISTPNVMAALRRLRRDQARPYNFALSPVLVNLSNVPLTLLAPFEKDSSQWMKLPHVHIHDGTTHSLKNPTVPIVVQTFEMVFKQYHGHREAKSYAPDGSRCKPDTAGLLKRYPVTATSFHLIGKETERGWEQNDDVSTLMPSLVRYGSDTGIADEQLRKRLREIPLAFLELETGLSRHTIVRARRGQPVHPRPLRLLKSAVCQVTERDLPITSG
jgi:hypothetical protein